MRSEMNLTIRDYFNRRIAAGRQPRISRGGEYSPGAGGSSFSEVLDASRSQTSSRGLSIQDYLRNRVRCHSPETTGKPAPASPPCRQPAEIAKEKMPVSSDSAAAVPSSVEPSEAVTAYETSSPIDDRQQILSCIHKAAARYRVPPALISAVVKAESDYQVRAVSAAGAQGLMQLMPATAREMGVMDPFDIDQNIYGGVRYLRKMLDQFNGDVRLALSAYNAGPGTVARFSGNVPYAQTRNYVQRVLHYAKQFSETSLT